MAVVGKVKSEHMATVLSIDRECKVVNSMPSDAGIGRPAGQKEVISHVLQGFSKKEREDIDFAIQDGVDTIKAVLTLGMEKALSGCRVPR